MTKPFFTAEDFPASWSENSPYADYINRRKAAELANAKVAPLKAENERLKEIAKEYDGYRAFNGGEIFKVKTLTEQNRIMREALESYLHGPWAAWTRMMDDRTDGELGKLLCHTENLAREALAKCKELEK